MKKLIALALGIVLSCGILAGCGEAPAPEPSTPEAAEALAALTYDDAFNGYWVIGNYGYIDENGEVVIPRDVTTKKNLQAKLDVDVLMMAVNPDGTCQVGLKDETIHGTWTKAEDQATEDKWVYEMDMENGAIWYPFVYADQPDQGYIPVGDETLAVMSNANYQ